MWDMEGTISIVVTCAAGIAAYFVLYKLLERKKNRNILNDKSVVQSGHQFSVEHWMPPGFFCSMCEQHLSAGYECTLCGVRVDEETCLVSFCRAFPCKLNDVASSSRVHHHHWVLGNVDPEKFCAVCEYPCGEEIGLSDFWCAWCQRAVHTDCKKRLAEECDRGPNKQSILPPNCVTLRKAGSRNQKQMVVDTFFHPPDVSDFRPIIVIVNPKSGSGAGESVLKQFRAVLHPIQVVDVTKSNLRVTFSWLNDNEDVNARMIIAGGDGTISLVMNDVDTLKNPPPVAILPLGTGNDLSRILGWGKENDGHFSVNKLLKEVQRAKVQSLDRWKVMIDPIRKIGVRTSQRQLSMTNYMSVGVDARVTFGMQTTRDSLPRALSSRLLNKFLFFTYGTKDVFQRTCRRLNQRIELTVDGQKIDLPEIEGLVFLNISCWGAGVKVWDCDDEMPQRVDDGLFEIFAVRSSFHIAQLQVGMSSPIRIAQGKEAILRVLRGPLPMQSDGEAWIQKNATITIKHKGTSRMLAALPNITYEDSD